jgi:hypothetical protein
MSTKNKSENTLWAAEHTSSGQKVGPAIQTGKSQDINNN